MRADLSSQEYFRNPAAEIAKLRKGAAQELRLPTRWRGRQQFNFEGFKINDLFELGIFPQFEGDRCQV
jgi:hypothetical protein